MYEKLGRFLWITVLYVVTAQLLFFFGHRSELRIEFWLPAGALLAATLRYGIGYAWAAVPAYIIVEYTGLHWHLPYWVPPAVGAICALNAIGTTWLIRKVFGGDFQRLPDDSRGILIFLFLSVIPFAPLTSLLALQCFVTAGAFEWSQALQAFLTWTSGSVVGTIVGAPAFLLLADRSSDWRRKFSVLLPILISVVLVGMMGHYADEYYLADRNALQAEQASNIANAVERTLGSEKTPANANLAARLNKLVAKGLPPALRNVEWSLSEAGASPAAGLLYRSVVEFSSAPLLDRHVTAYGHSYVIQFYAFPSVSAYLGVEWRQRLLLALQLGMAVFATALSLVGHGLHRQLERKQRSLESVTDAVLDSVTDAVLVVTPQAEVQSVNTAAQALLGGSGTELFGHQLADLVSEADRGGLQEALQRVDQQQEAQFLGLERALLSRGLDGREHPCELVISPFKTAEQQASYVVVLRDITERKLREQAVVAKEVAERSSAAKSRFLSTVRHEVRTPLNAIIGYSELLIEEEDAATWKEKHLIYQKIERAGRSLLSLLDGVLAISGLEVGDQRPAMDGFEAEELALDIEMEGRRLAEGEGCSFSLECKISGCIHTDYSRLRDAVYPLMQNAAKFNQGGDVTVTLSLEEKESRELIKVAVRDTGLGMEASELSRIFEAFHQVDSSTTREYDGLGLGLALSRAYAESLGGEILVQSTPGQGSTFTLQVPLFDAAN